MGPTLYNLNSVKIGCVVLAGGVSKMVGNKKTKKHASVIFHPFAQILHLGDHFHFLACGVISPT